MLRACWKTCLFLAGASLLALAGKTQAMDLVSEGYGILGNFTGGIIGPQPHCPTFVTCQERAPAIKFRLICPTPICDPCKIPHAGYYAPCWQKWPYPPTFANCTVPPPGGFIPPPEPPPQRPKDPSDVEVKKPTKPKKEDDDLPEPRKKEDEDKKPDDKDKKPDDKDKKPDDKDKKPDDKDKKPDDKDKKPDDNPMAFQPYQQEMKPIATSPPATLPDTRPLN
jgi:hypothetical protein